MTVRLIGVNVQDYLNDFHFVLSVGCKFIHYVIYYTGIHTVYDLKMLRYIVYFFNLNL